MGSIATNSHVRCWPIDVIDLLLRLSPKNVAAAHFYNALQNGDPNIVNFVYLIDILVQCLMNTTAWRSEAIRWCQTFYDDLLTAYCTNRPRIIAPTVVLPTLHRASGISSRLAGRDGPRCLIRNAFCDKASASRVPVGAAMVGSQVVHIVPFKLQNNFDFQTAAANWDKPTSAEAT